MSTKRPRLHTDEKKQHKARRRSIGEERRKKMSDVGVVVEGRSRKKTTKVVRGSIYEREWSKRRSPGGELHRPKTRQRKKRLKWVLEQPKWVVVRYDFAVILP